MPCDWVKGTAHCSSSLENGLSSPFHRFNSYTQHICVDDAVVIDPTRAENVITNDGTTMRIVAQSSAKPSACTSRLTYNHARNLATARWLAKHVASRLRRWIAANMLSSGNRQREVLLDDRAKHAVLLSKKLVPEEETGSDTYDYDDDDNATRAPAIQPAHDDNGAKAAATAVDGNERPASPIREDAGNKAVASPVISNHDSKEDGEDSIQKTEHKDIDESPNPTATIEDEDGSKDEPASSGKPDLSLYGQNEEANADLDEYKHNRPAAAPQTKATGTKAAVASLQRGRASSVGGKTARGSSSTAVTKTPRSLVTSHTDKRPAPRFADHVKAAAAKARQEKQLEAQKAAEEKALIEKEEKARLAEQRAHQLEVEKEMREEERQRRKESALEQWKIREEKRQWDAQRREENRKAISNAADLKAASLQDLEKIKAQNQFAERFSRMLENQDTFTFDPTTPRGPSQTVQFTSKFVDRLSDITEDMCVSGSLSIKAAKFGGSGRGSFVDSDKFKQSDLNFYISVKVVNQTINFKDALTYNPLRSVGIDDKKFPEVYGDSFISGFLEGGEFNALVSMKVLNKAKMTDIKAEAKVAFTAGPVDITAEANIGIARSNIETNTETTIQVSWCGGGHIKPMEQQWDVKSLMEAASRFPDLVADCPQRTYAILTKYDTLRSFVALKPAAYSPIQYENAQIYTNALMDSFMEYKSLYKTLGEQIFTIQGKTLEIVPWDLVDAERQATSGGSSAAADPKEDLTRFDASLRGLSDARKAIRAQMTEIVNEVDLIEKEPKKATDKDHVEPFQSPVSFQTRLPVVQVPGKLRPKTNPLTGKRIMAKPQSEEELQAQIEEEEKLAQAPGLYAEGEQLSMSEKANFDSLKVSQPHIGENLRVSAAVGTTVKGEPFNNLDFVQKDWHVKSIVVDVARGAIAAVEVWYENGLLLRKGMVSRMGSAIILFPLSFLSESIPPLT